MLTGHSVPRVSNVFAGGSFVVPVRRFFADMSISADPGPSGALYRITRAFRGLQGPQGLLGRALLFKGLSRVFQGF